MLTSHKHLLYAHLPPPAEKAPEPTELEKSVPVLAGVEFKVSGNEISATVGERTVSITVADWDDMTQAVWEKLVRKLSEF